MPGWLEVGIRSLVGLLLLFTVTRFFVRKPIGETSQFEFGLIASVAIILAVGSFQLEIPIAYVIVSLVIWAGMAIGIAFLSMKSLTFRTIISGKGIPVIKDGKILEDNLNKEHVTSDELLRKLRSKQVFQVSDVEFALLEGNGELNVIVKKEKQPITAKVLNKQVAPIKEPETVIMDGKILDEPLATRGFNRQWLEEELGKMDAIVENVFLGQVDEYGQLTIDLFDDLIQVPEPTELPLLDASLRKVQADLQLYALDTENDQAKQTYQWCADQMEHVHKMVSAYTKA
ncbi:DUF421 domain-containing protein [Halalkalibacter nanhaiisediminis]|uniref:Uncharacterized membrane protein YcaP (DUF421 family) n=1 Tax=Halalkalibacter nanhaiisediminis TaxID=688079 RepID=A0A562QF32_9BACI|nr:DUF421 domain-containing protein [Halalkalibacter nanhaiisediminis]TWI54646.1 uncharacterized membrane protein YcaP (DUF421 family) [Halalkalibacter nanhaiisediminis]